MSDSPRPDWKQRYNSLSQLIAASGIQRDDESFSAGPVLMVEMCIRAMVESAVFSAAADVMEEASGNEDVALLARLRAATSHDYARRMARDDRYVAEAQMLIDIAVETAALLIAPLFSESRTAWKEGFEHKTAMAILDQVTASYHDRERPALVHSEEQLRERVELWMDLTRPGTDA